MQSLNDDRLANGYRPDADAFMTLTQWLKMPAEKFCISEAGQNQDDEQPELLAEVGVFLRARKDLGEEEKHLQNVLEAAMSCVKDLGQCLVGLLVRLRYGVFGR
ncbi:hypothetical protein U2F26_20785 [Micromonospora sp. 4G57]|uniref:Uncharacterized protein n=1 Tax=Micromonospora sicca TaxID=2202420 RepID=A0ABU5JEH0_9ACTN|nr:MULTISPECIES: hypothetical protein [unclassified Micromonospora]MDZ5445141.1 hypothetical protein [Micromonospora sp. 4G57]MDZ5490983.1 hypothetical protein [Micromonospora sp. 4G53]